MRLFTAILPDAGTVHALADACRSISAHLARGRLTPGENLHLTLVFLGETAPEHLPAIRSAIHGVAKQAVPFPLELDRLGRFPKGQNSILWAGLRPQPALNALQGRLQQALTGLYPDPSARPYCPHITLGRDLRLRVPFEQLDAAVALPHVRFTAQRVSLMHSTRIDGALRYIELDAAPLTGQ